MAQSPYLLSFLIKIGLSQVIKFLYYCEVIRVYNLYDLVKNYLTFSIFKTVIKFLGFYILLKCDKLYFSSF